MMHRHIAYYWNHVTREEQPRSEDAISRGMDNLRKSAKFYFAAADKFPNVGRQSRALCSAIVLNRALIQLYRTTRGMFGTVRSAGDNGVVNLSY